MRLCVQRMYSNASGHLEPTVDEEFLSFGYIRSHGRKSFDDLVGSVPRDSRMGCDAKLYDSCFDCMAWCARYCEQFAKGEL